VIYFFDSHPGADGSTAIDGGAPADGETPPP
jgi:hypothetical protein